VTAQRLTGEKRAYDQMSDEEIESLKTSQGTPILRLEDVFKQYTDSITYVIELKDKNTVDFLLQLIDSYAESLGPIIVQSKDFEVLEAIHAGNNSIKTLLLAKDENSVFKALSKSNIDIISVNQQLMNEQIIESVHSNNKEFNVWTLNTVDAIANAIQLGVDSYFTDFTQKAIPLELALRS
jgi:glycerophosphoryl diester phosphodiesterase